MANRELLRNNLTTFFNKADLRALIFDLDENWDAFEGAQISDKVISIIEHFENRNRMPELISKCKTLRPNLNWGIDRIDQPSTKTPFISPTTQTDHNHLLTKEYEEADQEMPKRAAQQTPSEALKQISQSSEELVIILHQKADFLLDYIRALQEEITLSPIMTRTLWELSKEATNFCDDVLAYFKQVPKHPNKLAAENQLASIKRRIKDIKTVFDQEMFKERKSAGHGELENVIDELGLIEADFFILGPLLS